MPQWAEDVNAGAASHAEAEAQAQRSGEAEENLVALAEEIDSNLKVLLAGITIRVFSASSGHQVSDTRPNQAPSLHWLNLLQHQPRSLAVLCAEQDAKAELDRDCTPTVTLLTGDATGGFAPSSHCLADMVLHTYSETFGCVLLMQMAVAAAVRSMRHS